MTSQTATKQKAPQAPYELSIRDIITIFNRPLPDSYLSKKQVKNNKTGEVRYIKFLPWENVVKILNKYCVGWNWQILSFQQMGNLTILHGRLTIPAKEGDFFQEATGNAPSNTSSYGDPISNAEANALKRAVKKFGLGLDI